MPRAVWPRYLPTTALRKQNLRCCAIAPNSAPRINAKISDACVGLRFSKPSCSNISNTFYSFDDRLPQKHRDANAAGVMKFWSERDRRNRVLQGVETPEPIGKLTSEMRKFGPNCGGGQIFWQCRRASIDLMKPLDQLAQPDSRANHDADEGHRCAIGEGREGR